MTAIRRDGPRVVGVETTRGPIAARKIGIAVAGNTPRLAQMAGLALPIESHVLQAFVSEGLKPLVDHVFEEFGRIGSNVGPSDQYLRFPRPRVCWILE